MRTLETMRSVIIEVEALQSKYNSKMNLVLRYAGLFDQYQEYIDNGDFDNAYTTYDEAVERINAMYIPDAEHEEDYLGGADKEPTTFDDVKRLYEEWGMVEHMTFNEFLDGWESVSE